MSPSNKITLVVGGWTIQARLRSWGDWPNLSGDGTDGLYWRARKWNGHVWPHDENITWLRGWNHNKKTRDALVTSAALALR